MKQTYFNWSSGKDSALALYRLLQNKDYYITTLVTTVNTDTNRVSMHGLRNELLDMQLKALGFPHQKIELSGNVSMQSYDNIMRKAMEKLALENDFAAFGDIFLEDLKTYREERLAEKSIKGIFPLWKNNTHDLIEEFLSLGFKAITVCVNAKLLDKSFVGRELNRSFFDDLPKEVDPCGEHGEYHSFVYDGPIFKAPVNFKIGEKVYKKYESVNNQDDDCFSNDNQDWDTGFWYCDLIPD